MHSHPSQNDNNAFTPASLVRVFLNSPLERAYWSFRLRRSEEEIREAIASVGNTRIALARHFRAQADSAIAAEATTGAVEARRRK